MGEKRDDKQKDMGERNLPEREMREGMLLVTLRRPITLSRSHRITLQLLLQHIPLCLFKWNRSNCTDTGASPSPDNLRSGPTRRPAVKVKGRVGGEGDEALPCRREITWGDSPELPGWEDLLEP